jgi:hypothetical protein
VYFNMEEGTRVIALEVVIQEEESWNSSSESRDC